MKKQGLSALQKLIDRTVAAVTTAQEAENALCEYCLAHYGAVPGDIDADQIIDGVLGGCGIPNGMSAEDFDRIMRESTNSR